MKILKNRLFCDTMFFLALVFKMFSDGLRYFPVLDDYIQYGCYPLYSLSEVYLTKGTISTRPFASFLDPLLWGSFYPNLWVSLAIICVMFFLSAKFLAKVFERLDIHITPFLYTVYLLIPLGFEGTYWISASSRICVGMFFAALSALILIKLMDTKKRWLWAPYTISTILFCGFYESVMVFGCVLLFFVTLALTRKAKSRIIYLLPPVFSGAGMLIYYSLAKNIGTIGNRAEGFSFENFTEKLTSAINQCKEIFIYGGMKTTFYGAWDGLKLLVQDTQGLILLGFAILIALGCAYFGSKHRVFARPGFCILTGLSLFIIPLVPNVFTHTVWFTYRSTVTSFVGIVLMLTPLFNWLFRHRWAKFTVVFVLVLLFSLSNANELDTYKRVHKNDQKLLTQITQQLNDNVISGKKDAIVVMSATITTKQTSFYKDHVLGVFGSDWALTGAVRAKLQNVNTGKIIPIVKGTAFDSADCQIIYLKEN